MMTIVDCLRGGRHLATADAHGNCVLCGREKPTSGERFIAEFETDAVGKYGFKLLGRLPGVELGHRLIEHEDTREVYLASTICMTLGDEQERRDVLVDDAPVFFDPTWDENTLVFWVAEDLDLTRSEARARLVRCGLVQSTPAPAHEPGTCQCPGCRPDMYVKGSARQNRLVAIETEAWPDEACPDCNATPNTPCTESCPLRAYAEELKKKTVRPGDAGEADTLAPPTSKQNDVRPTEPPQVRWHVAYRCADKQVILDQNKLFVAEAVEGAAELVAAAPELLDLVDDLLGDRQRDRRIPEALALVERLRGAA
ncbi:hypothetical protein [Polyangium mundeleinium]|uniref:4Fe-4S ferredoxin-type domain-containing protein n=1 Tax=Polyangium mundeleinium TaxID=2995306 RepID=A0ABT5EGD1_9BACT|nr:hypothetical protein [Polyangium mundeleinium]MDC0740881.1 hypothetical protein [Polyangium mundeleinium]